MSIDKSKKYWYGDNKQDIIEYLNEYSENKIDQTAILECKKCGSDSFTFKIDINEGAVETTCTVCNKKHLLLDSEDYWNKCKPEIAKCPECKKYQYNVGIGFIHRVSGEVKWVFIGNRCASCGLLGSYGDWGINYGPTNEMEKNI